MVARRAVLPIGAAQLTGAVHIMPSTSPRSGAGRNPQNTGDNDNGGQAGFIIASGTAAGDGSIYVAMTAYDDAWVTTPPVGNDNTVNAPTTHGPNGNCIETVTNYYNGFGTPGTTVDQIQFYDFCANGGQGGFVGALPIDANFVRDYVRTYADGTDPLPRYISSVIHSAADNRWHAYLYNATLMQYVDYYASAPGLNSSVNDNEGWSIFETHYNGGVCSTLPDTSEESIEIRTAAGWQPLGGGSASSYSWGTCFSPPLSVPYYVPQFATNPSVAWTVTSHVAPALSEYARVVAADHPAAYYRLGDSGTGAVDSSGNGLTGTYGSSVKRGAASLLAVESSNDAAAFPGGASSSADIVSVAPAAPLAPAQSVSVEAWLAVARQNTSGTTDLVSYGSESAGQAYTLQVLANGTAAAYVTTASGLGYVAGKTVLAPGKAYLLDAVYDGSHLSLFVDGALDATAVATGTLDYAHVNATNGLALGSAISTPRNAFAGTLDDVAVYPTALTAAKIAVHWIAGSGVAVTPAVSEYAAAVEADAPAAFYRLSDPSAVAVDATARHNAVYGAAVKREIAGLVGTDPLNNAAQFPGGASSPSVAVTTGRLTAFEPAQSVTVETWVEPLALPVGTVDLVSYGPELLGQPYSLQLLPSGVIAMFVSTAHGYGFVAGRTALSLGAPHLVDASYNGSTVTVSVDGAADASAPATGALNYAHESAAFGLSIGTAFDSGRSAFAGTLDDVAVYPSALAATRVAAHWTAGSGHAAGP